MKPTLTKLDLAIYLPYNLMVETKSGELTELIGLKDEIAYLKGFTYPCDISDIYPLFKPLSELTIELLDISPYSTFNEFRNYIINGNCPLNVFMDLIENHYDVFQKIDEKLAIELK